MRDFDSFLPKFSVHGVGDIQTLSQIFPSSISSMDVPRLWSKTQGRGIVIAILDTGIQTHPDLIKNIDLSKCRSFIKNETIFDNTVGHGTHVSGIIGAVNNTFGVVGVAPEATIVSVKVLDSTGKSQDDSVAQGLKYCLSLAPDIINLSIGNANPMPDAYEYIKQLHKNGVILVAAAGNTGTEGVAYPAAYDEVIAVGSFSNSMVKDKSLFSSYGKELDLMAPGEEILSTYLNNQYSVLSGTSMASPFVSGVIALLLSYYKSKNKQISPDEVRKILLESCADAKEKGFDKQTGWGIVDPSKLFNNLPEGLAIKKPSFWQKLRNLFK